MRINFLVLAYFACFAMKLMAQNPICPIGTYLADPTARVWSDGRLYIYGSTDEDLSYWCSYEQDVLYTSDLKEWHVKPDVFASKGAKDQVAGTDALLFASDAMYKDGQYLLYFCTPDKSFSEGVAASDSPLGPFTNGKKITTTKYNQIDPTVFIDDDGQAYYYWGQGKMKGAKMKADMLDIDTTSIVDDLINAKDEYFHEGAFVFKRKDLYYVVYAHHGRRGRPTCLGYAISKSPLGPFEYKGVVIDNFGSDPTVWNNHGSIAKFKDQWYVFYHRPSHNSRVMRRTCMEPIKFNPDGTIDEVEMTSQGAAEPLSAYKKIDAERACLLKGTCYIEFVHSGNEVLRGISNNDCASYKYIDFGKGANEFSASIAPQEGGSINIRIDSPQGKIIGTLTVPPSDVSDAFRRYKCKIDRTKGVHALFLEFKSEESTLFEVDEFNFL